MVGLPGKNLALNSPVGAWFVMHLVNLDISVILLSMRSIKKFLDLEPTLGVNRFLFRLTASHCFPLYELDCALICQDKLLMLLDLAMKFCRVIGETALLFR